MPPGLINMWVSLFAIACMFLAVSLIYISRHKMKNKAVKMVTALFAYVFMFLSGFLAMIVLFGGPA